MEFMSKKRTQTSCFSHISEIRSYTGEKPFIYRLPGCDKPFTRSDALTKHMRLQHNILPPAPGRCGSRKRKRGEHQALMTSSSTPNIFKVNVDPHTPSEYVDGVENDGVRIGQR
ncbi:hypothetical protein M413DRAFT_443307 [Hebeloma cylindrosporum]|uniref:C2H2-type domain-containing protein n=1 Tax=Hebeloma cylindrosporum TaxID=76867 RepID=A0A0C2Y382_HEBCY|nr:hypothetical protein M413DRAFT_443307 [Hebeloma cylindrosporum h7]